jgi:putative nucleotidyltransferase with HDIG domain
LHFNDLSGFRAWRNRALVEVPVKKRNDIDPENLGRLREEILRDPDVARVAEAVSRSGRKDLYLVGGALRDYCLGHQQVPDLDFVTAGDVEALSRELAERLSARVVVLDERWGVIRLVCKPHGPEGKRVTLDFSAMQGQDIGEDLLRRDFTCNAMALSLVSQPGKEPCHGWWDPSGGLDDLQARTLRMVNPESLRDDPLRMLRAFRLSASLGFRIEEGTLETITRQKERILQSAGERIHEELARFFSVPNCYKTLLIMDRSGLLQALFPETEGLKGLVQGRHHHLDGWSHTLETFRLLEKSLRDGLGELNRWNPSVEEWVDQKPGTRALLKMAALFHDLGKPSSHSRDTDGEVHFYRHEKRGGEIVHDVLERIRMSRSDHDRIRNWVRYHMGPIHMTHAYRLGKLSTKARIRFLRRVGPDVIGMLLLSLADVAASRGTGSEAGWERSFRELMDSLFSLCVERGAASPEVRPLLTGRELMEALDISPGPRVGRLLRLLGEARIQGKIHDRDDALALARTLQETLPST